MIARSQPPKTPRAASPPRWRFQFGMRSLLGTMLLLCIPFAVWGALLRADPSRQFIPVILCLAMPVMVLFVAGLIGPAVRLARRLRRKRRGGVEDASEVESYTSRGSQ